MVASKLAARRPGHGGVSLEMGRKRSGAGFRRGRSDGTGRFRGPASAKTKETPRTACAKGGAGLLASLSEVEKRKFQIKQDQICREWLSLPKLDVLF